MSRADEFNAFYRESRARLLVQVYAYVGDTETAHRSLSDAYVAAGQHWRKLAGEPDKDAWMRGRAFKAAGKVQNRPRKPWYVRALRTADSHRPMLNTLMALRPVDRHLAIVVHLAGRGLATAAREAGLTDEAAAESLGVTATAFAERGVDMPLSPALGRLRLDLADEPVDRASRLRREGDRRRRANVLLAGLMSLAVIIGAGALTAAQPLKSPSGASAPADTSTPSPTRPPPATAPAPTVDADVLSPVADLERATGPIRWRLVGSTRDLGESKPYDECIAAPRGRRVEHFWVRTFESGRGRSRTVATEALELSRTSYRADRSYRRLVADFSSCVADNHQIVKYGVLRGVGDAGSVMSMRYVDRSGVHSKQVLVTRSGTTVVVWVLDSRTPTPVAGRRLARLAGDSVRRVCGRSARRCEVRPVIAVGQPPPRSDRAGGFLTAVDLPVFAGLTDPWAATPPHAARANPAATECDRANLAKAGATGLGARSFVVPDAPGLDALFGMTQTVGRFGSVRAADAFLDEVDASVRGCHDRQASLKVRANEHLKVPEGRGSIYVISLTLSESNELTFRVGLVRVGNRVAQVSFTPTKRFDMSHVEFDALIQRAALRITQS